MNWSKVRLQMSELDNQSKTKIGSFFATVSFATVLSQLPFFVSRGMASSVSMTLWGVASIICLFNCKGFRFRNIGKPITLSVFFLAFVLIAGLINEAYTRSSIPRSVIIAMFVLIVGNMLGSQITEGDLSSILSWYAYATVILAVDVYLEFFRGASISRIYVYDEKNSTAFLLLSGLIIFIFELEKQWKSERNPMKSLIKILCCIILAYCTFIMQCRAVYISIALVFVIIISSSNFNKNVKRLLILVSVAFIFFFLTHGEVLNSLLDKYIYGGRNRSDLNDLSSGRSSEWLHFWNDLGNGFLFGNGHMKRETLILTAILEFGFIFGLIVIRLAFFPIRFVARYINRNSPMYVFLLSIACSFVTNAFFEQLAPLGPGVKCFLLWLLIGIFSSDQWQQTYGKVYLG